MWSAAGRAALSHCMIGVRSNHASSVACHIPSTRFFYFVHMCRMFCVHLLDIHDVYIVFMYIKWAIGEHHYLMGVDGCWRGNQTCLVVTVQHNRRRDWLTISSQAWLMISLDCGLVSTVVGSNISPPYQIVNAAMHSAHFVPTLRLLALQASPKKTMSRGDGNSSFNPSPTSPETSVSDVVDSIVDGGTKMLCWDIDAGIVGCTRIMTKPTLRNIQSLARALEH